jgi:integrase
VFEAAVDDGLIPGNPITKKYVRELRLKPHEGTAPYTDVELAKLWVAMSDLEEVYVTIAKAASLTGARIGELVACSWDDLDLGNKLLHLRYTWNDVDGLTLPKDGESRTVNLIPTAVELFEGWVRKSGVQEGHRPIFPAPRSGEGSTRTISRSW